MFRSTETPTRNGSGGPLSPAPLRRPKPEYLPAYLSNGFLGVRVGTIPLVEGLVIVSGLRAVDSVHGIETFARGPYPFSGDIEINGHKLSRSLQDVRFIEQIYDFSCGELHSRFEFRAQGVTATVDVVSFCSRSLPTAVLQAIEVRVDHACELKVSAGLDQTGVPGRLVARAAHRVDDLDSVAHGSLLWETSGGLSRCGAAYVTSFEGATEVDETRQLTDALAPVSTSYGVRARSGRRYVVRQISVLVASALHAEPDRQACRLVSIGRNSGFDALRKANQEAWSEIWAGRVHLVGASERWQAIADAAFYYLQASAHPASLFSTAMFGLAFWPDYSYYFGHVMWDIETFAFPPFLLTAPDTARGLLDYRFTRLPAARLNASMQGYAGIQYPWESSADFGQESTPPDGQLLGMEQHVNLSVGLAFAQFCHASGDDEFARFEAWPVLRGIANWILSRVMATHRGLEIKNTVGIAENRGHTVDNDAYVNMAAIVVLDEAVMLGRKFGLPTESWAEASKRMFVPVNRRTGVIANHDRFTVREGGVAGATPEALAGFFPFGYRTSAAVERATLSFYLGRVEPYVGYPMLSSLLGVYAARLGDRSRSTDLFEAGYAEFITPPFSETSEFNRVRFPDRPRVGPLFANLGGFLTSLIYGLPRIHLGPGTPDTWLEGPITMPSAWEGIEVDRVWVRGKPMSLQAKHGSDRASLTELG